MAPEDRDSAGAGGFCRWLAGYLGCCPPASTRREARVRHRRVHMANERTFLAWLRTALAVMAFGFLLERFGLTEAAAVPEGAALVALGAVVGGLAALRFLIVERQIETGTYRPSIIFSLLLGLVLAALGLFLALALWD